MKLKTNVIHQYCLGNEKIPRRINDDGDGHSIGSVYKLYSKEYIEVIASLLGDLEK